MEGFGSSLALDVRSGKPADVETDARVELLFEEEGLAGSPLEADNSALGGLVAEILETGEAKGKLHEQTLLHTSGRLGWACRRLLVLGAGKRADLDAPRLSKLAGQAARVAGKHQWKTLVFGDTFWGTGPEPEAAAEAIAAGAVTGALALDTYKTADRNGSRLETVVLAHPELSEEIGRAASRGQAVGEAVNAARLLVNEPGNAIYPESFAERARSLAEAAGLQVEVLSRRELEEKQMGLLLAVGQGSRHEPRLVVFRYGSFEGKPTLGLVGKGITFDSGGISIKPAQSMEDMKTDMSGAAAVLGAMLAIARTKPSINVLGVTPLAENLPGGGAVKPGDVVKGMSGKSVEVVNTDAEGRMVLADALAYAQELGATHIVDLATLTGACVVALGHVATGALGQPQEWVDRVMACSRSVGEKIWQLPLYEEYRELLKSSIADIENSGGRSAGAITGAWFLKEFVKDETHWVHLDIAGTASHDKDTPDRPKGASGVGVKTLVRLAHDLAES